LPQKVDSAIPVIVFTGLGLTIVKQETLLGHGFKGFLQKPFDVEVLLQLIDKVIS